MAVAIQNSGFQRLAERARDAEAFKSNGVEYLDAIKVSDGSPVDLILAQEQFLLERLVISKEEFLEPSRAAFRDRNKVHERIAMGFQIGGLCAGLLEDWARRNDLGDMFVIGDYQGSPYKPVFWDHEYDILVSFYNIPADLSKVNIHFRVMRGQTCCHSVTLEASVVRK